jgi:hypothetical protein
MTKLPTTLPELQALAQRVQEEIERLPNPPKLVPAEALHAFKTHLGPFTNAHNADIERGLRAAYPLLKAAWEPADDGWIDWHGGECPVPFTARVDYALRGGDRYDSEAVRGLRWNHLGDRYDIVAYRIVQGDS